MAIPKKQVINSKIIISLIVSITIISLITYLIIPKETQEKSFVDEEKTTQISEEILSEKLCISPRLPNELIEKLKLFEDEKISEISTEYTQEECKVIIDRNVQDISNFERMWTEIYVATTRFDNLIENITTQNLEEAILKAKLNNDEIVWNAKADEFLKTKFNMGVGYPKYTQEEIDMKISTNKETIAIIPFEQLNHLHKIISVDNRNPLQEDFNELTYQLSDSFYISNFDNELKEKITEYINENYELNTFDQKEITTVIITGSSIIGGKGQFAKIQEHNDPTFPIQPIAETLQKADIAHISNESPFWNTCTQTNQSTQHCGLPKAIEMLNYAQIDIVGMTGNHIVDYKGDAFRYTMNLYRENNIEYFAAGNNEQEAHTPKILEVNGIKFGFIGYNLIPPQSYLAQGNRGGNAGISDAKLKRDIENAKSQADFVFVDMQWGDEFTHEANEEQKSYGKSAINYGANIVTGVHPHWVQGIEFHPTGVVFYGLGNFLFDQIEEEKTREGIIIEHLFYKDKYIGYNIIPIRMNDELQVNLADTDVSRRILETVFEYSNINLNN